MRALGTGSRERRARATLAIRSAVALAVLSLLLGIDAGGARASSVAASPPGPVTASGVLNGAPATAPGTDGKVAGMALAGTSQQALPSEISRLHDDGLNTISIFVWWLSTSQDPDQLTPYSGTVSDASIEEEVADAHQLGMQAILVPIFYCETCQGGWRGVMQPDDVDAFFASYRAFIDHYAQLAQATGVSTLFVGSEMDSLETDTSQWQLVISGARALYSGRIGYEENWEAIGHATFVNLVDVIGISAYFPLDDSPVPTLGQLLGDWSDSHASAYAGSDWVTKIESLASRTGKPILFGEVGYMSGQYAAKQPYLNWQGVTDWQLQADLYQAVLETFQGYSWWEGAVWWDWYIPTSSNDDGRTPRGKTAETFLQRWYADGDRPATPDQPLVIQPGTTPAPTSPSPQPAAPRAGPPTTSARASAPTTSAPARPAADRPATTTSAAHSPVTTGAASGGAVAGGVAVGGSSAAGSAPTTSASATTPAGRSGSGGRPAVATAAASPAGAGRGDQSSQRGPSAPPGQTPLLLTGVALLVALLGLGLWLSRGRLRSGVGNLPAG